mgnify:CR=1 FL=1
MIKFYTAKMCIFCLDFTSKNLIRKVLRLSLVLMLPNTIIVEIYGSNDCAFSLIELTNMMLKI